LAYVSFFQLHSLCLFCVSLYVVNLLAFLLLGMMLGRGEIMKFRISSSSFAFLFVVFVVGGIILHTTSRQYARDLSEAETRQYLEAFFKQTPVSIDVTGRPFWGNPDAKIVIAEFSDLECPYCKVAAFRLKPYLQEYKDKVKLVFLNYPLDQACNPVMTRPGHQQACQAAVALHCAAMQDKFWEYHDEAFDRQPRFSEENLMKIAKQLGLNLPTFTNCYNSGAARAYIASDVAQGNRIGVQSTPSIYINGRLFPNWISKRLLHQALEKIASESSREGL
ncbi:MAG TPA: hypothetical protein DF383_08830, partial [Deltaproteobacteria bacterium]|nr:hypothetical protein [Deltaproteobacteria bacterium]